MKLKLDHKSIVPLHIQAEELLRELIKKAEYQNGKLLPNEVELSEQLKISRNTLRQAINKLVYEGLLIRKKRLGTRVATNKVISGANNWFSFSQEMKILGIAVHNFELHVSASRPSKEAQSFFKIPDTKKVLKMERLRGKEDLPFVYFISEFNPSIPFNGSENFNRPLYEILEADHGVFVKTSREEINADGASEFIAAKLEIDPGDPILVRKRYVSDINKMPVEYNIGYYRADSFTYSISCEK
ncbi:MAG: GntR family transcriptional regulator [Niabella sp.]|nr:GntR family transcriptional regulator [Niabella sp.]